MTDDREVQEQGEGEGESKESLSDLDISSDEAEKVKGGRLSDPCEGGEVQRR